ncbi:MAG TPA: serine/threonine-protein kinase [Actinomycetota bacterium]|jgi:eukaryotic-like serine/threonine-protein kinase
MPEDGAERRIAQRYAMRAPALGRGGMGVVWRARDTLLGREVAIKEVLLPAALHHDERARVRARVMREARVAARLNHAGAVTMHDIVDEDGRPFIVMELVEAPTLTDLVAARGPLPPEEVAALGLSLLDTLDAAHRVGIVHRDVKPANVMVRPDGGTKLADFGIASVQDDPGLTATTGLLAGSPAFMAPEQAEAEFGPVGPPTDLWALGATMYFAVEGVPPFDRGGPLATLAAVVYEEPRPATRAGPLAPVLAGLLTKPPADRITAPDLRRKLRRVAAGGRAAESGPHTIATGTQQRAPATTVATQPPAATTARLPLDPGRPGASAAPVAASPRRRSGLTAVLVVILLALVGVLTWQVTENRRRQAAPAASPVTTAPGAGPWSHYRGEGGTYQVSHPASWRPEPSARNPLVEFHDPANPRRFVRVQVDQDAQDPLEAWQQVERSFVARHGDDRYRRIALERTVLRNRWRAAAWEFTYVLDGRPTRVYDLAVTTRNRRYAVQFQSDEPDWPATRPVLDGVLADLELD